MMADGILGPWGRGRAIVLTVVAAALGWVATRDALVETTARLRPEVAASLDPADAVAVNVRFQAALAKGGAALSESELNAWTHEARAALRQSPLDAAMIRMIASDPAQTRPATILALSERVSRRDPLMQLALIESSVRDNRVDVALLHYDRALSIYPDLRPALFPVLADALTEPSVRQGVADQARRRRPWVGPFIDFAIRDAGASPQAIGALLTTIVAMNAASSEDRDRLSTVAARMAGNGDYRAARALAMRAAGRDASAIDRIGFSPATWATAARPLTWAAGEEAGIDAQLVENGAVLVTARPGVVGPALFRMIVRQPGTYRFSATAAPADGFSAVGGRWNFICLREGSKPAKDIGTLPMPDTGGARSLDVAVDPDCAAIRIAFEIGNGEGSSDGGLVLRDISFVPS